MQLMVCMRRHGGRGGSTHGQKCETVTLLFIYSKALFE